MLHVLLATARRMRRGFLSAASAGRNGNQLGPASVQNPFDTSAAGRKPSPWLAACLCFWKWENGDLIGARGAERVASLGDPF